MKINNLTNMVGGWFVGNFNPTAIKSNDFEVAVKKYSAGTVEQSHHHKIATEITVIALGTAKMNGVNYSDGAIIEIQPGEVTDFEAITDVITVVVKTPSVPNDKYID